MRRQLIGSTALIALAAVLVLGVPLGIVESKRARGEATGRLEREADALAAAVDDRLEVGRPLDPARLDRLLAAEHWARVTDRRGRVTTVGDPRAGSALSVRSGARAEARVVVSAPAGELAERVRHIWLLVALLALGGTAAAVALAALQARRLARPLERLARTSTLLGEGDFSARAGHFGVPEIDAVASALDRSAVRIAQLLGREREFTANVSHQLRTPLTALQLRLEELARAEDAAAVAEQAEGALAEAERLERTIAELLAVARGRAEAGVGAVELIELVRRHEPGWRATCAGHGRRLRVETAEPVRVEGSAGPIGQALDVLVENALRHGSGTITVSVLRRGGHGCLRVEDEGPGIPEGAEQRIFERGSSLNGGTGIGLHLARALVEASRGRLVLVQRAPAAFEIQLHPAAPPAEPAPRRA
ncbi:MAG TPA: HAMP domain-containing sensor histidine kinase [Conexibacter sp.]|nr:HAMP domain-containing sensor histidine kinase [Conexibacter sp.]